MKLVAKVNDTGEILDVLVLTQLCGIKDAECDVQTSNTSCGKYRVPFEASVHLSTGMCDKNGREILVGDWATRDDMDDRQCIITDGTRFYCAVDDFSELLTPELAATLEVVR